MMLHKLLMALLLNIASVFIVNRNNLNHNAKQNQKYAYFQLKYYFLRESKQNKWMSENQMWKLATVNTGKQLV